MTSLEWRVVLAATSACLGLLLPSVLIARMATDTTSSASWALVFLAIAMVSFIIAGFVAGWQRPPTPMLHGSAAALIAAAVVSVLRFIIDSEDTGASLSALLIIALLALTGGVGGALMADWVTRRRAARPAPTAPPGQSVELRPPANEARALI